MSISVLIDPPEPRVAESEITVLVTGRRNAAAVGDAFAGKNLSGNRGPLGWDMGLSDDSVYVDPVTYTAMLKPNVCKPDWRTTASAGYERLKKADYTLTTPDKWIEVPNLFSDDIYLHAIGTNEPVTTNRTFEKNQGFYFSFYAFGTANDQFAMFQAILGGVGFSVYADGSVQLFKPVATFDDFTEAHFIGAGNLVRLEDGEKHLKPQAQALSSGTNAVPLGNNSLTGNYVSFMVLPCRVRELLFVSNRGGGFSHVFADLPKDDPQPVITQKAVLQWQVPHMTPTVQAAMLQFDTDGTLVSVPLTMREAPKADRDDSTGVYWDVPGYGSAPETESGLLELDGETDFVPDGNKRQCRLGVDLSSDGTNTPFVYGAYGKYEAVIKSTAADAVDIVDYVQSAHLSVPDSPDGVTLTVQVKDLLSLKEEIPLADILSNRAVTVSLEGMPIFFGRTQAPTEKDSPNPARVTQEWVFRDCFSAMDKHTIIEPLPFDGVDLTAAFSALATAPGYPEGETDIDAFDFPLPSTGQASQGEFALLDDLPATAGEIALEFQDKFAKNALMTWVATSDGRKFRVRRYDNLPTSPEITLYADKSDAAEEVGYQRVYNSFELKTLPPEANVIRVTGWDSRIDKLFQVVYDGKEERDPTTPADARSENWTGEPDEVAYFLPELGSIDEASYVLGGFRERLTVHRDIGEWTCQLLLREDGSILWKGDCVELDGWGVFRIMTIEADLIAENDLATWRPATYTGELVS